MASRTTLVPARSDLGSWAAASAMAHVILAAGLFAAELILPETPAEPLIDPDTVVEVALMPMPKAPDLPQRATRQAAPKAPAVTEQAAPAPAEAPPPPKVSDMVVHDEPEPVEAEATPAPEAKQVDNRPEDAVPQESTRKADVNAKMDDLLAELDDADDGPRDRDASSPDGMVGAEPSRTVGPGTGDPELRAYIQRLEELFKKEFRPIIKGQNLTAKVLVAVDDTGTVKSARIDQSSGNPSFDRSAVAAAEAVPKVPPPPERYRDGTPRSYRIIFND